MAGQNTSLVTDYVLKILGLDICSDIMVGDEMRRGISGGQKKRVTTAWAFALPIWVLRIPLSLLESGIWIALTYYTIGFAPAASRFFRQFLAFFGIHQMALSLFRFIAALGRTQVVANTLGTFTLLVVFVLGGFVVAKDDIKPWMIWGYYVSPMSYGQNAIVINEFLDKRWSAPYPVSSTSNETTTVGKILLKTRGMYTEDHWYWICVIVLVAFSLLFNLLFITALTYLNPLGDSKSVILEDDESKRQKQLSSDGQHNLKTIEMTSQSTPFEGTEMSVKNNDSILSAADQAPTKKGMVHKQQDLMNLLGAMYSAVLFLGATNTSAVQSIVAIERTVFYRERAAGMYSPLPYAFAQVAIEAIYVSIQTLTYSILLYTMIGFPTDVGKFFLFYYFILMCFMYFTLYGMMLVALTPNHQFAAIVMSFFLSFWNLFSGFLIPRTEIPIWWRWYYWASPVAWTIYGLVSSQVGDKLDMVEIPGAVSMTVKDYLKTQLGFDYDFLPYVIVAHVGWVLLFLFVFAYGIKFLNFQRR
ncbi:ABC-2 type transporter [Corchorus olitorius]|uniref:ABC-2 type transporter n=1 Tax=Corchorus olitorius TaxID=93759 RepID=A0A1R3J1L6_9ROSI|nr:ABC-2 type transporter [Corchorus olitorius]